MPSFIVLVRPYDDPTIDPDVWMVLTAESCSGDDAESQKQDFERDYLQALITARHNSPEEWNIDDVRKLLSDRWVINVLHGSLSVKY